MSGYFSANLVLALCLAIFATPAHKTSTVAPPHATSPAVKVSHGLDLAGRDTTCAPCRDFYQYANGAWVERTVIPAAYPGIGSFVALDDRNEAELHRLLEDAVKRTLTGNGSTDPNTHLIGTFYGTCMDSAAAEAAGMKPIEPDLARIAAIVTPAALAPEIARLHTQRVDVMFRLAALPDLKRSTQMIANVGQGGLGLPDRDYYTKQDSASQAIRGRYVSHVANLFVLIGEPEPKAKADADKVMEIETQLANASMTNVQRRDPKAVYHKMPLDSLEAVTPAFDWNAYLRESKVTFQDLNVGQPDFMRTLNSMLSSTSLEDWKTYLRWHVVAERAPILSSPFVNERFRFAQVLTGAKEQLPRWKRCVQLTDGLLGEALGREYVKKNFTPEAKARALAMVENLEAALKSRLEGLDWMTDSTRAAAIGKLAAFGEKIGYPDRWRDYSGLTLERGSLVENVSRATRFESEWQLARIGKPVDRSEWRMSPPTVNAYYNSSNNDINFPAGILQPPFFDPLADDAVNYGGMGAVIGHEMTHGFDDRGRQFDAEGNLRDWWTSEDAKHYQTRAARVIEQFNGYVAVDTLHVNGKLTLGENIADLGGLAVAYEAMQRSMAGKPRPPLIDGLTPEQRFFLSWAQVWRSKQRPESMRLRITTDSHSPARWRVNGPMSNLPEFAQAWNCQAGDAMVRPDSVRVRIW
jgi:putative endopeptidase